MCVRVSELPGEGCAECLSILPLTVGQTARQGASAPAEETQLARSLLLAQPRARAWALGLPAAASRVQQGHVRGAARRSSGLGSGRSSTG